jgi:hypothetical protein
VIWRREENRDITCQVTEKGSFQMKKKEEIPSIKTTLRFSNNSAPSLYLYTESVSVRRKSFPNAAFVAL